MRAARWSCVALMASGIAGVAMPERVAMALELTPTSGRSLAEVRAGLGGTYAALGGWALLTRNPSVERAVGVTWLGAGAARLLGLRVDSAEPDWTYWAYLAAEVGLGTSALMSRR